jgi:D-alanyl-D-alanine carboxypeptidase
MIVSTAKTIVQILFAAVVAIGALIAMPANAGTSILVDAGTGKVLSSEKAFQRWYPASLTKMMTTYIAFQALKSGKLTKTSPVKISANAAKQPPSRMGYKPGSVLTLDNALKIMLVKSANDIAVAVGETVGGKNYANLMNAEAKRLGMSGTHWVNANGLHSAQHYSTARDLAVLAFALRSQFPEYAPYFGIEAIKYDKQVERNYNILLGRFAGADGMKTGFVCAAGYNLIASATQDGRTLIAVVLGARSQEDRAEKAAAMLAEGFAGTRAGSAALMDAKPEAGAKQGATDMRGEVCIKGAQADQWDGRDVEGNMKINSPYITAMAREPQTVVVGLGGASGPVSAANDNLDLATIPVPTPRPARAGETIVPLALTGDSNLRKTMPVPATTSN